MALQDLILETDKRINNINEDKVIVRQSEKGLVLTATILKPDGTKYDLSNHKVQFGESKDGDKIVIDEDVEIDSSNQGVIHYTMNKAVYAASGEAWFEIFDSNNNVIDTTQNFYIQVMPQATIHITNDNYVSSLQAEINHFKANNENFITAANQELDSLKSQIQQSKDLTEKAKQDALNAIQEAKDTATTTLNNLNGQYSSYASKYEALDSKINSDIKSINDRADSQINSIKADWDKEKQAAESDRATIRQNGTDEINSIKSDWSKQTDAINADAKTKIDAAIVAVETARDNAIKQAVSDFSNQRDNLQADYNSWKQDTVNGFNSQLATLQGKIDAETKQQSDLKAAIDSARTAVDKIADVDFTKFAHKDDVDQALKSIDFGKIGIKENYLNSNTNVAQRTIFPVKQSDGNWIFDRASDDSTAETAKKALEQVLQNGKTLNQLSEQFNTKADKDDVDEALKKSNSNADKINDLRNGKLNFINASEGYDLLSVDGTWGIIEFNKIKDIKNLPPLSNKNWMYALKLIKDGWGSVIVFSQNNTIYQNVLNALSWKGWSRVLNSDDLTNLQNQINDRATNSTVNVDAPMFRKISNANTWQDILGVANDNQILESIRDESSGGNTLGNYGSAVAFGGGDTKGVLNVAYADHTARIIGGNGDRPQWHEDIAWKSDITNLSNQLQAQSSMAYDNSTRLTKLENKGNGFVPITQADYDALTDDQKANGMYAIGDSN